ncbi:Non-specific serine/threonine protein kinase [Bertholletia excelsa]
MITGKSSKESDVYSFGIVALEIACGRKAIDLRVEESQVNLLQWVWDLYGLGKLLEAADARLADDFDQQEMERLMIVGLWCAHPDYSLRPSIRQAINVLNYAAPPPILPAKLPEPTYLAPAPSLPVYSDTTFSESSQGQLSSYTHNTGSSHCSSASAAPSSAVSFLHPKIEGN